MTRRSIAWSFDPELSPRVLSAAAAERNSWVVVLAGGSGRRLAKLGDASPGDAAPKQFRSLFGGRSLLGDAIDFGEKLVPRTRIVPVVSAKHADYWRDELRTLPTGNVVVEPRCRGTAPGILLPVLAILARNPDAQVTVVPAGGCVANEGALVECLREAQRFAARRPDRVVLVSMKPDSEDLECALVVPGDEAGPLRSVRRIVNGEGREDAQGLVRAGALQHSLFMVGSGDAFLRLYAERAPVLLAVFFEVDLEPTPELYEQLYNMIPASEFCADVLVGAETMLDTTPAPECGWSDLATVSRVRRHVSKARRRCLEAEAGSLAAVVGGVW